MRHYMVGIIVILLVVLQQDYWQWHNTALVLGFLPYALAWHMGVSVLAAAAWFAVTRWAWPSDADLAQHVPETAHATSTADTAHDGEKQA